MTTVTYILADSVSGDCISVDIVCQNGFLEIRPRGYGEADEPRRNGAPIFMEYRSKELVVYVSTGFGGEDRVKINLENVKLKHKETPSDTDTESVQTGRDDKSDLV